MLELNEPKKVADSAAVIAECDALDAAIAELRAAYEQYFLGMEKRPPTDKHEALKKRIQKLRNTWTRQTAAKFRVQSLNSKFVTYERLWARTIHEIENGTYVRDVRRARRKAERQEQRPQTRADRDDSSIEESALEDSGDSLEAAMANAMASVQARQAVPALTPVAPLVPSMPPVAPVVPPMAPANAAPATPANAVIAAAASGSVTPGLPKISPVTPSTPPVAATRVAAGAAPSTPPRSAAANQAPTMRPVTTAPSGARAVSAPPPSSAPSSANLSDEKLRAVYDAFVKAKRRCNEDTSSLSYEQVATSLRKQVPELMKQHKAKAVEFKVVIKDGKAVLRAVPKDG